MFDYSILSSFVLFIAVCMWKVKPAVVAMLDEAIGVVRSDFDEVEAQIIKKEKELAVVRKECVDAEELRAACLQKAQEEVEAIKAATQDQLKNTREYYDHLRSNKDVYWAERLAQHKRALTLDHIFQSVAEYCEQSANKQSVQSITHKLTEHVIPQTK